MENNNCESGPSKILWGNSSWGLPISASSPICYKSILWREITGERDSADLSVSSTKTMDFILLLACSTDFYFGGLDLSF